MWDIPNIWKDGTCWIVGGGPSVATQFHIPKKVADKVSLGQAPMNTFSPYMSLLHDKHVIGINGAFKLGEWIDICYFGDRNWYFDNKKELDTFKGTVVGCAEFLQVEGWQKENVRFVKKSTLPYGIETEKGHVRWNYNSGLSAINLAYHLGCKRVILLGFDMALNSEGKGHWHNQYNGVTNMPFARHLVGVDTIAEDAKRLGLEIINASQTSVMTQFPKINVKDIPV